MYVPASTCQRADPVKPVEFSHIVKWFGRRVELNVVIEVDAGSVEAGGKVMATSIIIAVICVGDLGLPDPGAGCVLARERTR